ncbi:MAG: DUF4785 family protein [Gammaproteobacteria bacterium]|nr:DUF4785 family protein [Gammaproteobacteria bacterium]
MTFTKATIALIVSAAMFNVSATSLTPTSPMLVKIAEPAIQIEKQSVHFSQAITPNRQLVNNNDQYTNVSDEYWMEVSGKQLNQGVALHISQPEALIRLSAKQTSQQWLPDDHAIDPDDLSLTKNNTTINKAFSQKVSRAQLATANIFPNSSAVKLSKAAGTGKFNIKVTKALVPTQRYVVNVKEKGSPYQQVLATQQQSYLAGQRISFNAAVNKHNKPLIASSHQAFIKAPTGNKQAIAFENKDNHLSFELPDYLPATKPGELYELYIDSQVNDGTTVINRTGKIAFALAQPTARMSAKVTANQQQATISLEVASNGRYEVSGIVYGIDKNNEYQPIMKSASAHYLSAGEHDVALNFDPQLFKRSSLKPPYQLRGIKLTDQSRMAVLQRQSANESVAIADDKQRQGGALSLLALLGLGLIRLAKPKR